MGNPLVAPQEAEIAHQKRIAEGALGATLEELER